MAITEILDFYHVLKTREIGINIRILREIDESDIVDFEININTHFRELLKIVNKNMTD
jgi:hypothetical protein